MHLLRLLFGNLWNLGVYNVYLYANAYEWGSLLVFFIWRKIALVIVFELEYLGVDEN